MYNLGGRFALLVAPKASRRGAEEPSNRRGASRSCRRVAEEGEARRFGFVAGKETSIGSSFEASLKASLVASFEASVIAFSVEGWLVRSMLTPLEGTKTSKHSWSWSVRGARFRRLTSGDVRVGLITYS